VLRLFQGIFIFGDRIRFIRTPLFQAEFAKKLGVSSSSVQDWEQKNYLPRGKILLRIYEKFGININ